MLCQGGVEGGFLLNNNNSKKNSNKIHPVVIRPGGNLYTVGCLGVGLPRGRYKILLSSHHPPLGIKQ